MNWKELLQALTRVFKRLLAKFQKSKNPQQLLANISKNLRQQLAIPDARVKAWKTYGKALTTASQCGDDELIQVIGEFDPAFGEQTSDSSHFIGKILSSLLDRKQPTSLSLDAAWRLAYRLNDPASIAEIHQQVCLRLARLNDPNPLLGKLLKLHNEKALTSTNLSQVLTIFLAQNSFDPIPPWEAFFRQLREDELPQIHQVYALIDRHQTAAELAQAQGDRRSALQYLRSIPGKPAAIQALDLANQLQDTQQITEARDRVAQSDLAEGNYADALTNFQQSGNLPRVSDCYLKLGKLGLAIQFQPSIDLEWRQQLRSTMQNTVTQHLDRQEFLAAIELLKAVADAWRQKSEESDILAEADRTQRLLMDVVKTARLSFEAELSRSADAPPANLFKRWSLLEAAAGNYLEAGLQAKKAQDYFAASLLFEKAEAFGQALSALDMADPDLVNSHLALVY